MKPNQNVKWIRQPVTFIAKTAIKPLEQLTPYAGRYVSIE